MAFKYRVKTIGNDFLEYEIYLAGEIFCHLSENDFWIFKGIVEKSGNYMEEK